MILNNLGMPGFTEKEVVDGLRVNPSTNLTDIGLIDSQYNEKIRKNYVQESIEFANIFEDNIDIDSVEFHTAIQNFWYMPTEYYQFDIVAFLQSLCETEQQLTRVNLELDLYAKFNLLNLLRYMVYLKITADEHKIVWGVGRGSSCCSYVLYLLKIHRVNSLEYDLDIHDFLREKTNGS